MSFVDGVIRTAMLEAQSDWLAAADKAASVTERSVALVIADAFQQEASRYKNGTPTPATEETHHDDTNEQGPAPSFFEESTGG